MKIGVLSDTHLSTPTGIVATVKHTIRNKRTLEDVCTILRQHFQGVELILHAGDFVDMAVFEALQHIAPVEAVRGNMDRIDIQRRFPTKKVVEREGFKIGLTHGDGAPQGIIDRVRQYFPEKVDAIVFGHSHQPVNEVRDGILFFNPGSPTDRVFASYNSIGILELADTITGRLIRV